MKIDGNKIAQEIKAELRETISKTGKKFKLAVIQVGKNEVSERFIKMKEKFAADIGAETERYNFPDSISKDELKQEVERICADQSVSGVIVQLPLPEGLRQNSDEILNSIPLEKDVDVLSPGSIERFKKGESGDILPPVAGAVKIILEKIGLSAEDLKIKNIAVVGAGALVGKPAVAWLKNNGIEARSIDRQTGDIKEQLENADIIISGAGHPGLIKPDMVKDGVVIIDAGTSEQAGKLAGDMDPVTGEKAAFFTPVPGGVGPVTVAALFKNLVNLNI